MVFDISITRDRKGYFTLTIGGKFEGNYDTPAEAAREAEDILNERR